MTASWHVVAKLLTVSRMSKVDYQNKVLPKEKKLLWAKCKKCISPNPQMLNEICNISFKVWGFGGMHFVTFWVHFVHKFFCYPQNEPLCARNSSNIQKDSFQFWIKSWSADQCDFILPLCLKCYKVKVDLFFKKYCIYSTQLVRLHLAPL